MARHFDTMHDWLLSYFLKGLKTFRVVLAGIVYTYNVDPANVEYILKTNFSNFPKGEVYHKNMETLLGNGIFNSDREAWGQQRKTASFEIASRILHDFSTVAFRKNFLVLAGILGKTSQSRQAAEIQVLDDFTYKVIKNRREELQGTSFQGKETKVDLLSRFILLGEDSAQKFTDKVHSSSIIANCSKKNKMHRQVAKHQHSDINQENLIETQKSDS